MAELYVLTPDVFIAPMVRVPLLPARTVMGFEMLRPPVVEKSKAALLLPVVSPSRTVPVPSGPLVMEPVLDESMSTVPLRSVVPPLKVFAPLSRSVPRPDLVSPLAALPLEMKPEIVRSASPKTELSFTRKVRDAFSPSAASIKVASEPVPFTVMFPPRSRRPPPVLVMTPPLAVMLATVSVNVCRSSIPSLARVTPLASGI